MGMNRWLYAVALIAAPALYAQSYPPAGDPRNGLKPGRFDAGVAAKGMKLVSFTAKPALFDTADGTTFINSDIAFRDHYVYQGNFVGFSIWDIGNPAKPELMTAVSCATSQGDPSIVGNLLFISAEGGGNRNDCAKGGWTDPKDHMTGVRIYDVSNPRAPKLIKNVQTCKGSHTHTLIPSPTDKGIMYIYISGSQAPRSESELSYCKANNDPADVTNVNYRLEIIKVPLAHPEQSEVIGGARIFTGIGARESRTAPAGGGGGGAGAGGRGGRGGGRGGRGGADSNATPAPPGPRNCHDVTAYPAMNLLAGACGSHGLLVDISNPEKPVRLDAQSDSNFSLWHTAVFSNDGKKVVFTDEWGGGTGPMCQATSMLEMGGNTTLTITDGKKYTKRGFFKIPSSQTAEENCVSHNGGLVPVPGRDIMVQGWYQGGVDAIDFTDPDHPFEIAYYDRGAINAPPPPMTAADSAKMVACQDSVRAATNAAAGGGGGGGGRGGRGGRGGNPCNNRPRNAIGGSWGAYYWNGLVYSSELDRGLDVFELQPTDKLSANELAAAKLVRMVEYNPQSQPKIVWPAAFPVIRSYLDQLVRNQGLAPARTTAIDAALKTAEGQSGAARGASLNKLAADVDKDAAGAKDSARVKMMAQAIRDLAAATK
ncbi:MAG TPA: hypothetical protein VE967_14515 [Gemmatimonadaceae bacterium]|nr:hypothetical protein [Gemmatimonadaceae bacterium]